MAAPRSVRIPKRADAPAGPMSSTTDPAKETTRFVVNTAGTARAIRLFWVFGGLLAVVYILFVGLAFASHPAAPGSDPAAWGLFTLLAVLFAVSGWWITLGRTPRGAWIRDDELAVKERLGRVRRFPRTTAPHVARRYGVSPLGPEPTEFVELTERDGVKRTYLVGKGFFDWQSA